MSCIGSIFNFYLFQTLGFLSKTYFHPKKPASPPSTKLYITTFAGTIDRAFIIKCQLLRENALGSYFDESTF